MSWDLYRDGDGERRAMMNARALADLPGATRARVDHARRVRGALVAAGLCEQCASELEAQAQALPGELADYPWCTPFHQGRCPVAVTMASQERLQAVAMAAGVAVADARLAAWEARQARDRLAVLVAGLPPVPADEEAALPPPEPREPRGLWEGASPAEREVLVAVGSLEHYRQLAEACESHSARLARGEAGHDLPSGSSAAKRLRGQVPPSKRFTF